MNESIGNVKWDNLIRTDWFSTEIFILFTIIFFSILFIYLVFFKYIGNWIVSFYYVCDGFDV